MLRNMMARQPSVGLDPTHHQQYQRLYQRDYQRQQTHHQQLSAPLRCNDAGQSGLLGSPHHHYDPAHAASIGYVANMAQQPMQMHLTAPPALRHHHSANHFRDDGGHNIGRHCLQQQTTQQQLSLAAGSFDEQHTHHLHLGPSQTLPLRTTQPSLRCQHSAMAYSQNGPSEEELAEMQKLSSEYEPEVTGPLVGARVPSSAITTEYASADPVLQAKTADLPSKYAFYRTVRGDGMCGWRAIAYGYFEILAALNDPTKFLEEEGRLRSLGNLVKVTCPSYNDLLDDFSDEVFTVLRKSSEAVRGGEDVEPILLETFNDESTQNYIITYLKILTTAWMKSHSEDYAPFLVGSTVQGYCDQMVMPMGAELENVSLMALKDVFVAPAGISLEVVYLDRSEGAAVNTHRFDPTSGSAVGTIRLLYRPGHYDIVYKAEDSPIRSVIPTYLQFASQPYHEPVYNIGVSDFMTMIPGMSYANSWMDTCAEPSPDYYNNPAPGIEACSQPSTVSAAPAHRQQEPLRVATVAPASTGCNISPTYDSSQSEMTACPSTSPYPDFRNPDADVFRRSRFELELSVVKSSAQLPYQTAIFKNSVYNTSHFNNDHFQPEMWNPEDVYGPPTPTKRHKG